MKGEMMLKLLEICGSAAGEATDFLEAFLNAGYGASYGKLERELARVKQSRAKRDAMNATRRRMRQRYHSMAFRLKKDGLIVEQTEHGRSRPLLTKKGREKMRNLAKRQSMSLPEFPRRTETAAVYTIVAFDIPEDQRLKRDWLREALRRLGFTMIQKSVWIGRAIVPRQFLDDLHALQLAEYIEIFEISKKGSLAHIE